MSRGVERRDRSLDWGKGSAGGRVVEQWPSGLTGDREIERYLASLPDRRGGSALPKRPKARKLSPSQPHYDACGLVYPALRVDLTAIEGIDQRTASVLLGEIGPDLSRFPMPKKFCAWLGLCPQPRQSGRTSRPGRVRPGINRAAQALRLAARSLHHSQSALGAFYRTAAASAAGCSEVDRGDGAQAGTADLRAADKGGVVRGAGDGGLRAEVRRASAGGPGASGGSIGLPSGAYGLGLSLGLGRREASAWASRSVTSRKERRHR